eukprot:TRINITY_DN4564_c0_g2_i1.p1 TRINITY_DN4564_c0_g2~~TRINITY_DN4564_c0_g2_i1.p1  ORF type:complete len:587 (+),score=143.66 TRINITY_DN4564_c0_g2_i1:1-1761(+)
MNPATAFVYAELCKALNGLFPTITLDDKPMHFRQILLKPCQEIFESTILLLKCGTLAGEDILNISLRNLFFLGELYNEGLAPSKTLVGCLLFLSQKMVEGLDSNSKLGFELAVHSFSLFGPLLVLVGKTMEAKSKPQIQQIFEYLDEISKFPKLPEKIRESINELKTIKKNSWVTTEDTKLIETVRNFPSSGLLKGQLKKQGKVGWKMKYYQITETLVLYSSKEDFSGSKSIHLDSIINIIKNDKSQFDVVCGPPNKTFHFQTKNTTDMDEWIQIINLRRTLHKLHVNNAKLEKLKQNEMQETNFIGEVKNKISEITKEIALLDQEEPIKIKEIKEERIKLEKQKNEKMIALTVQIKGCQSKIMELELSYNEDLLSHASCQAQMTRNSLTYTELKERVKLLEEKKNAQTQTILALEDNLQKIHSFIPENELFDNSVVEALWKKLTERQASNRLTQENNSSKAAEIGALHNTYKIETASKLHQMGILKMLINQYQLEYSSLVESFIAVQGTTKETLDEFEHLKQIYFSSLYLVLKLQYQQAFGCSLSLPVDELYPLFENLSFVHWRKELDRYISQQLKNNKNNSKTK